ncbi:hypothetical protein [Chryseobacterium taichungense]|uniref:hypothetical protein n=1 Tax=Chryseobacterium taichungense TaxID=295069 RepID=UPI0028AAA3BC|nr:hypothetical protein [Chryseobacterium taichungense]
MKKTLTEDKILLKELVDMISILGDQKNFTSQVQLFTENAVSQTRAESKVILELKGRDVMAKAFLKFLKDVELFIIITDNPFYHQRRRGHGHLLLPDHIEHYES